MNQLELVKNNDVTNNETLGDEFYRTVSETAGLIADLMDRDGFDENTQFNAKITSSEGFVFYLTFDGEKEEGIN